MTLNRLDLDAVARIVDGELCGDPGRKISNLSSLEDAGPDDLTFLVKVKDVERLEQSGAGAALVPQNLDKDLPMPVIKVRDPYLASAIIHNHLLQKPFQARGIHHRACIGEHCSITDEVTIAPCAVIGDRVVVGKRVVIGAGTVVGDDVIIGDDVELKANVTVYDKCVLGNRVIIHSGTVVGSDGYGYATDAMGRHVKRPHVGRVLIDDDVEIGSNVSIDRGAFGNTWIQSGVKIDNQVQIAHNVVIGANSLIVAQVGLAGSCSLGRNVVLGGKVGVNGHIHLDDQVMAAAGSNIHASLPKGAKVGGSPAIDVKGWAKSTAIYSKLPQIYSELKKMRKTVAELEGQRGETHTTGEQHD